MRSCLKGCCVSAAWFVFLACNYIVGCGDSTEPPRHVDNMRADPERDAGATSTHCVDDHCDASVLDDRWSCPDSATSARTSTVRYSVHVVDFLSGMPRKKLKVKACRNSDVDCDEPVSTFVDTEETGHVQLELPNGFLGFFELTSDAVDTLLYITSPITKNTIDRDLTVPTPDTIELLVSQLDTSWDPDKGLAVLEVLDCSGTPQGGIHFDCSEGGDAFYMVDQAPDKNAQMTVYDPTTNTAEGGFVNLPPGIVHFSAHVGTDPGARSLGSFNAQARPRTLTIIDNHL